jgi:hypothetical protein
MPNVDYPNSIFENSVEDLVGISPHRHETYSTPLHYLRGTQGRFAYLLNNRPNTCFKRFGYPFSKNSAAAGSDFANIG